MVLVPRVKKAPPMEILVLPLVIVEPPSDVVLFPRLMDELPIWILVLSRLMEVVPRFRAVRPSVMLVFPMELRLLGAPEPAWKINSSFCFSNFFLLQFFFFFFGKGSWGVPGQGTSANIAAHRVPERQQHTRAVCLLRV